MVIRIEEGTKADRKTDAGQKMFQDLKGARCASCAPSDRDDAVKENGDRLFRSRKGVGGKIIMCGEFFGRESGERPDESA